MDSSEHSEHSEHSEDEDSNIIERCFDCDAPIYDDENIFICSMDGSEECCHQKFCLECVKDYGLGNVQCFTCLDEDDSEDEEKGEDSEE